MRQRDQVLEAYRIAMMFGICLLHAINECGHANLLYSSNLTACVDAFALLSGWFGLKFSFRKVLHLWSIGLYAAFMTSLLDCWLDGDLVFRLVVRNTCDIFNNYWFLHVYVLLLALSPIAERAFENGLDRISVIKMVGPILFVVFGWSFLTEFRSIHDYIPKTSGFGNFSALTLFGVYLFGRLLRKYSLFDNVKTWQWVVVMIICCILIPKRFGFYDSPFVLMLTVSSFNLFRRWHMKNNYLSCAITFVSPSVFSIYLLHTTPLFLGEEGWMRNLEEQLQNWHWPYMLTYLTTALFGFVSALILDLPRRTFFIACNWMRSMRV